MFQHIFWFFGHPEVYILILPAFGVVCQIIPTFSRKPLFGYRVDGLRRRRPIAFLSLHRLGAPHVHRRHAARRASCSSCYATMLIAVPTGVKVFNWIATMWQGSITLRNADAVRRSRFIFLFTIGGFTGLMLAIVPADFQLPRHLLRRGALPLRAGAGSPCSRMIAGVLLLAARSGPAVMYNETGRQAHFWLSTIGVQRAVLPAALPRPRGHAAPHTPTTRCSSPTGTWCPRSARFIFGVLAVAVRLPSSGAPVRSGEKAADRPWEGAHGLEWELPTPAPYHSWETPPSAQPSRTA
jgi:cytochrome c oxidase subunit 1